MDELLFIGWAVGFASFIVFRKVFNIRFSKYLDISNKMKNFKIAEVKVKPNTEFNLFK